MEWWHRIFNTTLYDNINIKSVLYWVRVNVANRMATSNAEWHQIFYK